MKTRSWSRRLVSELRPGDVLIYPGDSDEVYGYRGLIVAVAPFESTNVSYARECLTLTIINSFGLVEQRDRHKTHIIHVLNTR